MSSQIDFKTMPNNVPSLCIPRVFNNIDEKRIRRIFVELNLGEIQRIDLVSKTTEKGERFNRVFIHFKHWFSNENADISRDRLLNGKEIKIIYDDPWFWKISAYREANKNNVYSRPSKKPVQKKAIIQFDSDEERPREDIRPRPREDIRPRPREDNRRPRPREDIRPRPREEIKAIAPRSPSNSPPRERINHTLDNQLAEKKQQIVIEDGEILEK
jgi:hypothetical protein